MKRTTKNTTHTIKNLEKRCSYAWAMNYEKDALIHKKDREISMLKKQLKLNSDDIYNMDTSTSFKDKINILNSLSTGFLQDEPINKAKHKMNTYTYVDIDTDVKPREKISKQHKLKPNDTTTHKDTIVSTMNKITDDNWYTIKPSSGKKRIDTFYNSVAMNIDDDFIAYKFREREVYVKTLKHKMAVDLIEQNLYRLYQYHHIRTFKKSTLEEDLIEGRDTDVTKRYLSDYLDINILCIDRKTLKSYLYRDTYYKTLSILLIIELDGTFKPLLSSSGNHFIHPDVFQDIIKKYPIQNLKVEEKPVEDIDKPKYKSVKLSEHFGDNKLTLYSISRYTLSDLQKIAEDYDIPLHNIRELKSGEKRLKNKTKRELYDLISEKAT